LKGHKKGRSLSKFDVSHEVTIDGWISYTLRVRFLHNGAAVLDIDLFFDPVWRHSRIDHKTRLPHRADYRLCGRIFPFDITHADYAPDRTKIPTNIITDYLPTTLNIPSGIFIYKP
jgi:hypothetical protein